jgi:O-antigen/teichoic acid export membrane protein
MSTGKRAGLGFISLLTRNVLGKVMGIFSLIVLANVLSKNDFGVVAITDILLNLISVLGTVGLSDFLVAYKKDNDEAVFQSAFWLNVCATLFILILVLVIAPFWATKYNDQRIIVD